jgi:hypothetical protein
MLLICVAIEASVPIPYFSILPIKFASDKNPGALVIPSIILLEETLTYSFNL